MTETAAYAVGDRVIVVEHDPKTRQPKVAPRIYPATVKRLSSAAFDYVTVECDENRADLSFYRDTGWNTGWDNGYRWRVQPATGD